MVTVRSLIAFDFDGGGKPGHDLRQERLDAIDDLDDVGARLALDAEDDRRRGIGPGAELGVLSGPLTMVATSDSRTGPPLR